MIFIYEKATGEVRAFYSGDISQIHNFDDPNLAEACFPDDPEVISNPYEYKVVVYEGVPVTYQKKPELKLVLDKETIIGDGEDFARLKVEVANIHPLEAGRYKKIKIRINGEEIEIENGEEIELASYGDDIFIIGEVGAFRGDIMKRIIVGKKTLQTSEVQDEIKILQAKIQELEEKLNKLSKDDAAR